MVGWFKLGCTLQNCSDKLEVLTYIVFLSFLTCLMQYSKHLSYLLGGLPNFTAISRPVQTIQPYNYRRHLWGGGMEGWDEEVRQVFCIL